MKTEIKRLSLINKNINRGYRDLIVWQESVELYAFVKAKIKTNNQITIKVKDQVENSIFSVQSNIAEGYCRRSIKENIQFISIALASLGENYSQLFTLINAGDIEIDWFNEYDKNHYSLENKLLKMNKVYLEKLKNKEEWKDDYIIKDTIEHYGE